MEKDVGGEHLASEQSRGISGWIRRDTGRERREGAETARRAEAAGARAEGLQVRARRGRGSLFASSGERLVSTQPQQEPGRRQQRLSSSWEEAAAGEGS